MLIDKPAENIRLVIVAGGTGASTGFALGEDVVYLTSPGHSISAFPSACKMTQSERILGPGNRSSRMKNLIKVSILSVLLIGSVLTPALAQVHAETVKFPRGSSGTTIEGSITGDESVRYSVGVSAGQVMDVQLDTDNASSYFNITAPGAGEALYNGSISGNGTSFVVPSSGNYVVDVYLMRNAARRGETANYDLTLYVENAAAQQTAPAAPQAVAPPSNGTPSQLDKSQMPLFCVGEASAEFGVRPQEITVNAAFQSGSRYVTQGYYDRDGETTFFNCWFALDGSFDSLD